MDKALQAPEMTFTALAAAPRRWISRGDWRFNESESYPGSFYDYGLPVRLVRS